MADVANKNGILAHNTTFVAGAGITFDRTAKNGSAHVGKAVMQSAADTVVLVTAGLEIFGILTKVEPDGFCSVQDRGYGEVPDDGTAITYTNINNGLVGGATAGTVKSATAVPAAGAIRRARAIKAGTTGIVIADIG